MKSFIVATLLTSAAAFVPNQKAAPSTATVRSTSDKFSNEIGAQPIAEISGNLIPATSPATISSTSNKFSNEIGAQPPLGFFDPMGFLASEDDTQFEWLREAEIKHGRISMLAVIGYLTTYSGVRIEGMEEIPCGFAVFDKSLYTTDLARANVIWTIFTIVILETALVKDAYGWAEFPGDYRNGVGNSGWDRRSDAYKQNERAKELNNGRAAMMGILGLVVHESLGNVDTLLTFIK
eukprot:CAMPEP_0201916990 /NCGR_PEP_ID=MMETSP0903-20130614/6484_1 /ASSEMBLY_ACC=CAM_ASM_000552 /TAXON_ID=420261 /ORGANISM="Thalassiosira antarctica, Strain CCMP982" /LENGTH=235 /DNA_ID=CAMNT_0048452947 /DNA_START=243 /DNA_END=950 /DNA_ORIENTATION=+